MLVSTTKIYLNFAAAIAVAFMITGLSSAAMADEITAATLITKDGEVVQEATKKLLEPTP